MQRKGLLSVEESPDRDDTSAGSDADADAEEYDQQIKKVEEANETTKEGGESNTPTVTPQEITDQLNLPENTPVTGDNNGDTGTSTSDPIDDETQKTPKEELVTPTGETIVDTEDSGQPWGGPPED